MEENIERCDICHGVKRILVTFTTGYPLCLRPCKCPIIPVQVGSSLPNGMIKAGDAVLTNIKVEE